MLASFAMDVVQWLVPRRDDAAAGVVFVCFAPAWADRLPAMAGLPALRRRSAPMVSRHLPRSLAVAVAAADIDDDDDLTLPDGPGQVAGRFAPAVEGEPILPADSDDVRFAAVLGEFVAVVVDLCEAAGLPVMGAVPVDERRGLQILFGGLNGMGRVRLGDALLMLAAATQTAALARGFSARAVVVVVNDPGRAPIDIDGRLEAQL